MTKKKKKVKNLRNQIDPTTDALRHRLPLGDLIGYKKVDMTFISNLGLEEVGEGIVTLFIPKDADAICGDDMFRSKKSRCSKAVVMAVEPAVPWKYKLKKVKSFYAGHRGYRGTCLKYKVGKVVKPDSKFDKDTTATCSTGIHFFLDRNKAEKY